MEAIPNVKALFITWLDADMTDGQAIIRSLPDVQAIIGSLPDGHAIIRSLRICKQ